MNSTEPTEENQPSAKEEPQEDEAPTNKAVKIIAEKVTGTVKWFNVRNGYGFINRDDTKEDVFVHQTAIKKNNPKKYLRSVGDEENVEFDVIEGQKGLEAANVTGPNGEPVQGSKYAPDRRRNRYRGSRGGRGGYNRRRYRRPRTSEGTGEEKSDNNEEHDRSEADEKPRRPYRGRGRGRGGYRGRGSFRGRGGYRRRPRSNDDNGNTSQDEGRPLEHGDSEGRDERGGENRRYPRRYRRRPRRPPPQSSGDEGDREHRGGEGEGEGEQRQGGEQGGRGGRRRRPRRNYRPRKPKGDGEGGPEGGAPDHHEHSAGAEPPAAQA